MGTTEDPSKMLHLIVSTAVKTLKVKAAVIFRRDDDTEDAINNAAVAQVGRPGNTRMPGRRTPSKSARNS